MAILAVIFRSLPNEKWSSVLENVDLLGQPQILFIPTAKNEGFFYFSV